MRTFILILFCFLLPAPSFAAELTLRQYPSVVHAGDTFTVEVFLDTGTDVVNAIEGSLRLSPSLSVVDTGLSGSLVPLWLAIPEKTTSGTVTFAGVLPGGYQGTGSIFTLVVTATQREVATISFGNDTKVYRNDGEGTAAQLSLTTLTIPVGAPSATLNVVSLAVDILPPEPFVPILTSGEPFGLEGSVLVFATQDKDSGVLRYELARSYNRNAREKSVIWQETTSPYVFAPGDSAQYLFVRAVDRAGITRVATVPPQVFSILAFLYTWWVVILLAGLGGVILLRKRISHTQKSR